MKKFLLLSLLAAACQGPVNREIVNYEGEKILVGEVNWEGLSAPPYNAWFSPNYLHYRVDSLTLAKLKPGALEDVEVVIFLGTWCPDSQQQVPQMYRILDYLHFDLGNMKVYALERTAEEPLVLTPEQKEQYGIRLVPTFIFYRQGREIGRIVEFPQQSLEKDMVRILNGQ